MEYNTDGKSNKGIVFLLIVVLLGLVGAFIYAYSPKNNNNLGKKKTITFNNKTYRVIGMAEEIKKYIGTSKNSCYGVGALILTGRNNLYFGSSENRSTIKFNKIDTDLDIYYITSDAVEPHLSGTGSCNRLGLFVVLSDKQIRPIKLKYDNKSDVLNATIADYDVQDIVYQLDDLLIFKDKKIVTYSDFVRNNDKRIKYQGNDLKIDVLFGSFYFKKKMLNMDDIDTSNIPQPHTSCHLAIVNKKLYKLCGSAYAFEPPRNISLVDVANEKEIDTYKKEEDKNNNYIITINYIDGSVETYKTKKVEYYEFK